MTDTTSTVRVSHTNGRGETEIGWGLVGAASVEVALSDDSAASYVAYNSPGTGTTPNPLLYEFGTFALPSTDQLRYIRPWFKADLSGGDTIDVMLRIYKADLTKRMADQVIRLTAAAETRYNLQPLYAWPDGEAITITELSDGILWYLTVTAVTNYQNTKIYEMGMDIVRNQAPTVALVADLLEPHPAFIQHGFTYTDAEGDLQERIQDRIYQRPGNTWPAGTADQQITALDAAGVVPIWSDEFTTNFPRTKTVVMPPVGVFRRYVRAADEGSGQRFGSWNAIDFTMWTPASLRPKLPVVGIGTDPNQARVTLTIQAVTTDVNGNVPGALGSTPDYYEIQRSTDGGVTWTAVPTALTGLYGSSHTVTYAGTTTTFHDRYAPREVKLLYRVRSVVTGNGTNTTYGPDTHTSAWVTSAVVRLPSDGRSRLVVFDTESLDLTFDGAGTTLPWQSAQTQYAFQADGRAEPIIYEGTIQKKRGVLMMALQNDAEYAAFNVVRATNAKLLLKTIFGQGPLLDYWIKLGTPVSETLVGGVDSLGRGAQIRTLSVPIYEVDSP